MVSPSLLADLRYGPVVRREMGQAVHIPYLRHLDDQTILTKQGFLVSVLRLSGLCFQTLDQANINLRYINRNVNIRALGSSRFAIFGHVIRRAIEPGLEGAFENPFLAELDARYMASLQAKRMFVNEIYLTVIRRPMEGKIGAVDRVFDLFHKEVAGQEPRREQMIELKEMVSALERFHRTLNRRKRSISLF